MGKIFLEFSNPSIPDANKQFIDIQHTLKNISIILMATKINFSIYEFLKLIPTETIHFKMLFIFYL